MDTVFLLSNQGTSFATRNRADEIAQGLWDVLDTNKSQKLIVDFTGVRVITPSFASAFIEQLCSLLKRPDFNAESVTIRGDSPLVRDRFQQILEQHLSYSKKTQPLGRVFIG